MRPSFRVSSGCPSRPLTYVSGHLRMLPDPRNCLIPRESGSVLESLVGFVISRSPVQIRPTAPGGRKLAKPLETVASGCVHDSRRSASFQACRQLSPVFEELKSLESRRSDSPVRPVLARCLSQDALFTSSREPDAPRALPSGRRNARHLNDGTHPQPSRRRAPCFRAADTMRCNRAQARHSLRHPSRRVSGIRYACTAAPEQPVPEGPVTSGNPRR